MSKEKKRAYIEEWLPPIKIGERHKKVLLAASIIQQKSIAELERSFHERYLEKYLDDINLVVLQDEVFIK